ncbi:MAG: nucleotide exchange factor GrpE [Anaerolineae bacterium]
MKEIHVKANNKDLREETESTGTTKRPAESTPPPALDEGVVQEFERELAEARRQADENHDKYLRAVAELENVRKRLEKAYQDRVKRERQDLLRRFLEVADNLERALHAADDGADIVSGVELTYRHLQKLLSEEGVEAITAVGEPFDALKHEAIGVISADGVEDETVIAEERRGYTHHGELLRPSRVHVAKQPQEPSSG